MTASSRAVVIIGNSRNINNIMKQVFISKEGLERYLSTRDSQTPQRNFDWTTDFTVEMPILLSTEGPASSRPTTLVEEFRKVAKEAGEKPALSKKVGGKWQTMNYGTYFEQCKLFARGLVRLGVMEFHSVNINGFNSPEWCVAFFGSLFAKCFPVGVYTTNAAEACLYVAEHSECQCLVLENATYLAKYQEVLKKMPQIKAVVLYNETKKPIIQGAKVFLWQQFLDFGGQDGPSAGRVESLMDSIRPGNTCTLVYTSGTTGPPKGVLLSHDNYIFNIKYLKELYDFEHERGWVILSYLPLSHVAGQALDVVGSTICRAHVYFADPTALQGSLVTYLKEVRPTFFLSVPRVWQKIEEQMKLIASKNGFVKRKIAEWAKGMGAAGTYAEATGKEPPFGWSLAKKVVFDNVKAALGLDQVKYFLYGAAPLSSSVRSYFMSLNFLLINVYGMSECAGPETFTQADKHQSFDDTFMKEAGFPIEGTDLIILNPDKDGNGEICWRGRNRFLGYFKDEKETMATIDREGYLHSGDVGRLDSRGNLFITGRIKELIITAGGENVAPILIENAVKEALPFLSQVVVIGDKRKFLTCLLTLKCDPQGKLLPECVSQLEQFGLALKDTTEAAMSQKLRQVLEEGIAKANAKAISKAQHLAKFALLREDFTIDNGTMTPTMKLKRKEINKRFAKEIEAMYELKGSL